MRTYVAFFKDRREEIKAASLFDAKQAAIRRFNVSRRNESKINITLAADENGNTVWQSAAA